MYDILRRISRLKLRCPAGTLLPQRLAPDDHHISIRGRGTALTDSQLFVAGDWGTSHLRLFLCDGDRVVDRHEGPGVSALQAPADHTFLQLVAPWSREHGPLPAYLSGMVGSRNGWKEAAYVPCPVDAQSLAGALLRFEAEGHRIAIVPGVSCTNPQGAPDVMRGEETQLIGAMALHPELRSGTHLIGLPGTHTKWALLDGGRLVGFQTSFSGELYAVLREHSMLTRAAAGTPAGADANDEAHAFQLGLARNRRLPNVPLTHLLFEVRSRQLAGDLTAPQAVAFLSGLIIGQDIAGALTLIKSAGTQHRSVPLIGAPQLLERYHTALTACDIEAQRIDATESTILGLKTLARISAGFPVSQ